MVRGPYFGKDGLKKGAWSKEEDDKLRAYIRKYGHWNWRQLPKFAGLQRCGKSCRIRWLNYLRPDVKHGGYSKEEEDLIIQLYDQFGSKWSKIAQHLPGRTDNEVKNYWHTHLKKHGEKNHRRIPNKQGLKSDQTTESSPNEPTTLNLKQEKEPGIADPTLSIPSILESSSLVSPSASSSTASLQNDPWIEEHDDDKLKAHIPGHGVSNVLSETSAIRLNEAPRIHEIIKNEEQFIMGSPNFLLMDGDTNFLLSTLPESSQGESSFLSSDVNFMADATNSMDWIVGNGSNPLEVLESDFWTEPFVLDLDINDVTKYDSSISLNSLSWELNYIH